MTNKQYKNLESILPRKRPRDSPKSQYSGDFRSEKDEGFPDLGNLIVLNPARVQFSYRKRNCKTPARRS